MTMNVRLLYTFLLLVAGFSSLFAQTFTPLGGYDFPQDKSKPAPVLAKMDCGTFDDEGIVRVLPGGTAIVRAGLDTLRLGTVTYDCLNCNEAQFGTATFANDTLVYGADAGAEEGFEELRLVACNAAGVCSPEVTVQLLVQRAGTSTSLGSRSISPGETIDVAVPLGDLPGGTFCRTVESCSDDYLGREQRAFFQFGLNQDNEIRYVAARAGGTDRVCVTLCTELGLCDVYTIDITINRPTISLPFFDDFSYDGFRPDEELWQDEDVLVNRSFPVRPPSIGVATFDGVDHDGRSYTDVSGTGPTKVRDYLTSSPINLQGRSAVTLNFYLQPRGLGNRPERQDSFLVQFLDNMGEWRTVLAVEGLRNTVGNNQEVPFAPYTIAVPPGFLYSGFQFRFANKGNEAGAVDMWHLDYVKLDDGNATLITQDLALVEMPEVLLEPYTSMPIRHYQAVGAGLLRDSITLALRNHRNDQTPLTTGNINVRQPSGITIPGSSGGLISNDLFPNFSGTNSVPRDTMVFRRADLAGWNGYDELVTYLANADVDLPLKITTFYSLTVATEDLSFAPGIFENSNLGTPTVFDEYLAYDDGSAEVTLEIDEGNTIVQAYETYVNDQLTGVQVRIPRGLGELGNQDLKLVVYAGDTMPDSLIYEEDFEILYPEDFFFDSLQGFTTYLFDEVIDLPAGTIFVGWEQQRADRNIGVGFDRNNSPENVQWFSLGGSFQPLTGTTTGAIMLRPLLSGFSDFQTDTDEPYAADKQLEVYPNPSSGTLHLRSRQSLPTNNISYRLFSVAGALLQSGPVNGAIEIGNAPPGIYLLELSGDQLREVHRVVKE